MATGNIWNIIALTDVGNAFDPQDFINKIFPNGIYDLVIQLGAFVVLLLVVFFLGYKPVRKMLKKRADYIEGNIASAEADRQVAALAAAKKEETIEEGKKEAERILTSAKRQAELEAAAIIASANEEAAKKKQQADLDIALAKEKSKAEVRDEIVSVALLASSQILGREVDEEDNKRLVGDFVSSLEEQGK